MATEGVHWDTERVTLRVKGATQRALNELAAQVETAAKINIQANGQIDTGAMLNSTYMVTPGASTYAQALTGAMVRRPDVTLGPEAQLPGGQLAAAVACGVEYAIYQEMQNSFLYRGLEQVARQAGGVIERVGREEMHD